MLENVSDLVAEWHEGNYTSVSLAEYLGMTQEQYTRWVTGKLTADELADLGFFE